MPTHEQVLASRQKGLPYGVVNAVTTVANPNAITSVQEATANATDLTTAQALANSLKTKYNALQVDVVAIRTTLDAVVTQLKNAGLAI